MSSYIPIESVTLGSAQSSVTFSAIPTTKNGKTLRDLVVVVDCLLNDGTANVYTNFRFNADTGANYNYVNMRGDGSVTGSVSASGSTSAFGSAFIRTRNTSRFQANLSVFDFAQTDKHKSTLLRSNDAGQGTEAIAHRWASTSAITSLTVLTTASNFAAGSTFYLFGIEG